MVTCKFGEIIQRSTRPRPIDLFSRDLEKLDKPIYSVKGHGEIINAIDGVGGLGIGEGAPEIGTASRDGALAKRFLATV